MTESPKYDHKRGEFIGEIWKPILGYKGIYSISCLGRLRRETSSTNIKAGSM